MNDYQKFVEYNKPICGNCHSENIMTFDNIDYSCSRCLYLGPSTTRKTKWDNRFLELAKFTSAFSKDPSTKAGAVIVSPEQTVVSTGYNGFPAGVNDDPERYNNRELKYKMVAHCEINAILFAKRDVSDCTLYTYPFMCCSNCAKYVIQSGIKRCVAPQMPETSLKDRWGEDIKLSQLMFSEAGVELYIAEHFK